MVYLCLECPCMATLTYVLAEFLVESEDPSYLQQYPPVICMTILVLRGRKRIFFFFLNSITMQFITALLQMSQDNWTISFLSWLCCKCHTTIGLFHWDQMNEVVKKDRTPKSFQDVGKLARAQNNPKSYSFPFSSLIFPWLIRTTGNEKYHNQILQNSEGPLPF